MLWVCVVWKTTIDLRSILFYDSMENHKIPKKNRKHNIHHNETMDGKYQKTMMFFIL